MRSLKILVNKNWRINPSPLFLQLTSDSKMKKLFSNRKTNESLEDIIKKQRMSTKIQENLKLMNEVQDQDTRLSGDETPDSFKQVMIGMNLPFVVYAVKMLGSDYFTPLYTNSIGNLIDWVAISSGATFGIIFGLGVVNYKERDVDLKFSRGKRLYLPLPFILANAVSMIGVYSLSLYGILPTAFGVGSSLWVAYKMSEELSAPRYLINVFFQLSMLWNLVIIMVVFSLISMNDHVSKMKKMKIELEEKIGNELQKFKNEDERREAHVQEILNRLKNPNV